MRTTDTKPTMSIPEAAKRLGVAPNTIRRALFLGQLKAVQVGLNRRVKSESVEALLRSQSMEPTTSLATVQGALREHFGVIVTPDKAEKICSLLGHTSIHSTVSRKVLETIKAKAGDSATVARVRAIALERKEPKA